MPYSQGAWTPSSMQKTKTHIGSTHAWRIRMENQTYYTTQIPQGLLALAGGRDLITTPEFAQVFSIQPQTARKNYCLTGEVYGIRPTKVGNRLLWSVTQIAAKLKEVI